LVMRRLRNLASQGAIRGVLGSSGEVAMRRNYTISASIIGLESASRSLSPQRSLGAQGSTKMLLDPRYGFSGTLKIAAIVLR
jgi:hypothetical protein